MGIKYNVFELSLLTVLRETNKIDGNYIHSFKYFPNNSVYMY